MKKLLMTFLMTALLSIVTIAGNERTRAGYSENTQDFVTDTLPNGFYYLDYFHCDMFVDRLAFNILSKEERTVELTSLCAAEMWSDRWIYRMDTMNIPEKVTWNDTVYTVKAIGPWAFCYSEIKHLVIPSTVTEIKDHAFSFIENLEKLVIPNSVTIIGDNAFAGTQMNENVGWPKHVVFPDDMMTLGTGLFAWGKYGSDNLMAIFPRNMKIIPENTYYRGYISEWRDLPESVEVIDKNAFYGNMFKIIHLPPLLREIRDGAFERCNDLKNVTIPASVEYIGQKAFSGGDDYWYSSTRNECTLDTLHMLSEIPCNSMLELTKTVLIVPDGTKEAYRQAWNLAETPIYEESELGINNEEAGAQDDINYDYRRWAGCLENDTIIVDGLSYFFNIDSTAVHPSRSNTGRPRRVIPESVEYGGKVYPVYLVHQIFEGDTILEDIELRCKMRELVSFFNGCTHLEKVELPNSITQIGPHAFDGTKIKSIVLPKSLKRLLSGAFYGCADLETIVVNDNIEEVDLSAINRCPKLKSFRFPASVKNILNPFYLVDSLKTIIFDDGDGPLSTTNIADLYSTVYRIDYLYCGRRSMNPDWEFPILKQLVIGEPVRILELKNINIEDASRLKVYARSTSPQDIYLDFGDSSEDIYSKSTLIVPEGTREMYISTGGWRNFAKIVEGDVEGVVSTGVQNIRQSTQLRTFYDLNGRHLTKPKKGINIIRSSDGTTRKVMK